MSLTFLSILPKKDSKKVTKIVDQLKGNINTKCNNDRKLSNKNLISDSITRYLHGYASLVFRNLLYPDYSSEKSRTRQET